MVRKDKYKGVWYQGFVLLVLLMFACQPLPNGQTQNNIIGQTRGSEIWGGQTRGSAPTVERYTIRGQVVTPSAFRTVASTDATLTDRASIRLIKTDGDTIATGLTDAFGNFTISPQFTVAPNNGDLYILEAAKGTQNNQVSYSVARLRTFIQWTPDGWVSISGVKVLISAETTTVAILQELRQLNAANTINSNTPVIEPGLKVFSSGASGITVEDYNIVYNFVQETLADDGDPIAHIGYNDVGDFFYKTIITRPFLSGDVSTISGGNRHLDGIGTNANFFFPNDMTADSTGAFLYLIESWNSTVRKLEVATGQVTTVTGEINRYGFRDNADPNLVIFYSAQGVAHDEDRNKVYVADYANHRIREVDAITGATTTLAGTGGATWADGNGTSASFRYPQDVAYDGNQYLYVADGHNHKIRRIDLNTKDVITIAGTTLGYTDDPLGVNAKFQYPVRLAYDGTPGNTKLYVAGSNHAIRSVELESGNFAVTTLAGGQVGGGGLGLAGYANGVGNAAMFSSPRGMAFDQAGRILYVADYSNHRIRQVNVDTGATSDVAGSGSAAFKEGIGNAASFYYPVGVALSGTKLYVSDAYNHRIRRIDIPTQTVDTFAGELSHNGPAADARYMRLQGLAGDAQNNIVYTSESYHNLIRKIDLNTNTVTTLAGNPEGSGSADGNGSNAQFNNPWKMVYDGNQFLYVVDYGNNSLRRVNVNTGDVTTVNGGPGAGTTADGPVIAMRFIEPRGITYDSDNQKLYITEDDRLREVDLVSGQATTVAGGNGNGWVDGPLATAQLSDPQAVTYVGNGVFFVVEGYRVRKVDLNNAQISTVAGGVNAGYSDEFGTNAVFYTLYDVVTDGIGNLYLADYNNWRVRKFNISTGEVSTVAGGGTGFPSLDGKGSSAKVHQPYALYYDSKTARLYVGEYSNVDSTFADGAYYRPGSMIRVVE